MWDAAEAVLRGMFIALNAYMRKEETSKINKLSFHLRKLEKEQIQPKVSTRKEIIKTRAEINEIENRKSIEEIK